jgi:hypothetical protein
MALGEWSDGKQCPPHGTCRRHQDDHVAVSLTARTNVQFASQVTKESKRCNYLAVRGR